MKNNFGFIEDILEHVLNIEEFLSGVSEMEFKGNKEKKQAVIRSFEVIGEATKRVENQFKVDHPKIPCGKWQVLGMFSFMRL